MSVVAFFGLEFDSMEGEICVAFVNHDLENIAIFMV